MFKEFGQFVDSIGLLFICFLIVYCLYTRWLRFIRQRHQLNKATDMQLNFV